LAGDDERPIPDLPPDPALEPAVREHRAALERTCEEGRREYGAIPLGPGNLARRLLARWRAPALGTLLARPTRADLFIAVACDAGTPGAWETLASRFFKLLTGLAVKQGLAPDEADELISELPGLLQEPPAGGGASSLIGTYEGAGRLLAFLAVIVVRRAVDRIRRRRPAETPEERASLAARTVPDDPAALAIEGETARAVESALGEGWKRLSGRESLALLYRFRDGLPQKRIAELFQVGEPRLSVILKTALDKVRSAMPEPLRDLCASGTVDPDRLHARLRDVVARRLEG
jgi:RNA polymerase sigma factor (sigma-70 family)